MKRMIILTVVLGLFFAPLAAAQDTLWTRTYGGDRWEVAYSVQETLDGGYVVAGWTDSFEPDRADIYLVRTDTQGNALWARSYGDSSYNFAHSVRQTSDGGYVMAGKTGQLGFPDLYVVKTDALGDTMWTRTYGDYHWNVAYCIEQTVDGGYAIAGETWSVDGWCRRPWLLRTDSSGDTLWTKMYNGSEEVLIRCMQQTVDGGYILAGMQELLGGNQYDIYLLKVDASGDSMWARTYGGNDWDDANAVQQTPDGGYVVAGYTVRPFGHSQLLLMKIDAPGEVIWTRTYGLSNSSEAANAIEQTSDGGYIAAGTFSAGGSPYNLDVFLLRTDASGDTLWTRTYGGYEHDQASSVQETADGRYLVAGATHSFGVGPGDFWLLCLTEDGTGAGDGSSVPECALFSLGQNYPNPFNASTAIGYLLPTGAYVKLEVYNLIGKKVTTLVDGEEETGYKSVAWDASSVCSGLYFYKLTAGDFTQTKRMMLVK